MMPQCKSSCWMQVVNYVLTKPAREALFTVVTSEERYKGKLCMDTVIVRLGDTVAAGLFQVLEGILHVGKLSGAAFSFHSASITTRHQLTQGECQTSISVMRLAV